MCVFIGSGFKLWLYVIIFRIIKIFFNYGGRFDYLPLLNLIHLGKDYILHSGYLARCRLVLQPLPAFHPTEIFDLYLVVVINVSEKGDRCGPEVRFETNVFQVVCCL